jgi:hypothetical protein
MSEWTVEIPGVPPTLNHTYHIIYRGPRCPTCKRGQPTLGKSDSVETWQTEVAWRTIAAKKPAAWKPARRTIIEIEWYMPREGRDADGPIKALLDGIKVALGVDDRGFMPRVMRHEVDHANPRTIINVTNAD